MAQAFGLLVILIALFASERMRMDLVALLGVVALILSGLLTPNEALAGFSDPLVLSIAGLFVVGGGLMRTGVADRAALLIGRVAGKAESTLIGAVMVGAAVLSAFMSSTGTVAVLLPAVVKLARRCEVPPSRLLLPLAYGALLGGLLTLIGTAPNLVVSSQLQAAGREPFSFFSFTPVGLVLLAGGVTYMIGVGARIIPARAGRSSSSGSPQQLDLAREYQLDSEQFLVKVGPDSPAAGHTVAELELRKRYGVTVLETSDASDAFASPEQVLTSGARVRVQGPPQSVLDMASELGLLLLPGTGRAQYPGAQTGLAEVLLTPRSQLLGQSLKELLFRDRMGVTVLALLRQGKRIAPPAMSDSPLQFGDTLLVAGPRDRLELMSSERRNFVVIAEGMVDPDASNPRAWTALALMSAMLLVLTLDRLPMVAVVLVAAMAMVLTRCLTVEQAYRSLNWESLVLIAGMLPMATALEKTGGINFLAEHCTAAAGGLGAEAVLLAMLLLTTTFSQFLSNTAATVLVAPLALRMALSLGLDPRVMLMMVAVGASTPMSSPVLTLVLGPGGFRFGDFVRCGIPLQLLLMLLALLAVPRLV